MIRALVCEDSGTARQLLVEMLRSDPEIEVVGEAKNGIEAVEMTKRLNPDVVTMDILMPELDGLEATRRIMTEAPTPIVIVSAIDVHQVVVSMRALRAGALTLLAKPAGPGSIRFEDQRWEFLQTVKAMSAVKVVRHWARRALPEPEPIQSERKGSRLSLVAIAASTGGPAALARILSGLPADFPAPILVVQHIAKGFGAGFVAWLNTMCRLPVRIAADGELLRPGTAYVAPDDSHLGLKDTAAIAVSRAPPIDGFRPSATFLFDSAARVFGSSALALVLTGMGQDGVPGLRALRARGGRIMVQDQETSVVFGMPGATISAGLADVTVPLEAIAARLQSLAGSLKGGDRK